MCTYTYLCACVHTHLSVHMHTPTHIVVGTSMHIHGHMCTHIFRYTYTYRHAHLYTHLCAHRYICASVGTYRHKCICVHPSICTCVHKNIRMPHVQTDMSQTELLIFHVWRPAELLSASHVCAFLSNHLRVRVCCGGKALFSQNAL